MPTFEITLDDTSPMIRYSSDWRPGSSVRDILADRYSEKTFTMCQVDGDSFQLEFFGTVVGVFGAHRPNHGAYQALLDGIPATTNNGSSGTDAFMQSLYNGFATLGVHNLTFTNQESRFLDVDYITFETSVGQDDEELIVNTYQDNHPAFVYTPDSSWSKSTDKLSWLSGSSAHATSDPSATAKFTFQGKYNGHPPNGYLCPSGAAFTVMMDNGSVTAYNASQQFFKPKEILYYAGNLGKGNHTLQIQINSSTNGTDSQQLVIDYAEVYTSASLGGSFLSSASFHNLNVTAHSGQNSSTSLIAGLAIISALAISSTLVCMYLIWRLRRENKDLNAKLRGLPPVSISSITPFTEPPTTSRNDYYTTHNTSSRGVLSSGRAFALNLSRYVPQSKRNVANSSGRPVSQRRESQIEPPQYTEGL
ncbi:hypothetical protein D9613_000222 [Agrocybe pediades]|uniref:Transmembrane protein n=1 Tax=Agrocybe pediades TaxID=84607 RepID=A0A8H4R2Y2_9AGAR|nr:hypothetical protein D9613_000222 [Agrocybe pediades]